MDSYNTNPYYNLYIYVHKIPQDISKVTDYSIYADWFNREVSNEENVVVTLYCNISLIGNYFYCIYYLKILKKKFIQFEYSNWINEILKELKKNKIILEKSIQAVNEKINKNQTSLTKNQKSFVKDSIFNSKIYGLNRYGIEKEYVDLDIIEFLSTVPRKIDNKDLYIYQKDSNFIINNMLEVNYNTPDSLSVKCIENDDDIGHNLTTLGFYFKNNSKIDKFICGPLLQGYLTQYGHSLFFKNLRIKKYQLYHFESIFDQETNVLFVQFITKKEVTEEVIESITEDIKNITISEDLFSKMKLFLSNEYRFKFSTSFGYLNYILNTGHEYDVMRNIFKLIDDLSIKNFKNFLESKELIKMSEEYG